MGKKYIIELPENTHWIQWLMEGTKDHHPYMDFKQVEDLTPYIEPDLGKIKNDAFDDGYKCGLADAWETARKIECDEGIDMNTLCTIFGRGSSNSIIRDFSASEAIAKIKEYEDSKQEIKIGDEVKTDDGQKMVIAAIVNKDFAGLADDGRFMFGTLDGTIIRTGRHFPEIAAVLEKMRGEQE